MASRYTANGAGGRPTLKVNRANPGRKPPVSDAPWWGLFAAGGTLAALTYPIHILIDGILGGIGVPTAGSNYRRMRSLASNPLVKLFLLANISLPLFHAVHRFRLILFDLGVHQGKTPVAVASYGTAMLGTLMAAWALLRVSGNNRR